MLIKCPSCSKSNDLNFEKDVSCGHCKTSLRGHTYGKIKKTVGTAVVAFGVGVFATSKVGGYVGNHDRYSIKNEYAIIDMCLNSSQRPLATYKYTEKKQDCICALGEVQKNYKVKDYNEDQSKYLASFEAAARQCKLSRTSMSNSR